MEFVLAAKKRRRVRLVGKSYRRLPMTTQVTMPIGNSRLSTRRLTRKTDGVHLCQALFAESKL